MYYSYRFVIGKRKLTQELIEQLQKFNIQLNDEIIQTVTIRSDETNYLEISKCLSSIDAKYMIETIYSDEELASAKWMTLRSKWRYDYPQPENEWKEYGYDLAQYCTNCGCGKIQTESFKLKRTPKWGKRSFCQINWVEDQLFACDNAREILESEQLLGFSWLPVKKSKGDEQLQNIQQLIISSILDPGYVINEKTEQEIEICGKCNHVKSVRTGKEVYFYSDAFQNINVDIVYSHETFGLGLVCARLIIISQKLYQVLKKHKLDSSLVFEPITFIEGEN